MASHSDFFAPPEFGARTNTRAEQEKGIVVGFEIKRLASGFRSAGDGDVGPSSAGLALDDVRWGGVRGGDYQRGQFGPPSGDSGTGAAQAALAAAQAALSQAEGEVPGAVAAEASKRLAAQTKGAAENLARQAVWRAKHTLKILKARNASAQAKAQAQAAIDAATAALAAAAGQYQTAFAAWSAARGSLGTKRAVVRGAAQNVLTAQDGLAGANEAAADAQYNYGSYSAANPGYPDSDPVLHAFIIRSGATYVADALAKGQVVAGNSARYLGTDSLGDYYQGGSVDGRYRIKVSIAQEVFAELKAANAILRVHWVEISRSSPTDRTMTGTGPVSETITPRQEDIALAGAVAVETGGYEVYSAVRTVNAPATGGPRSAPGMVSWVGINGPATVPTVTIKSAQSLGLERCRQGFAEHETPDGAPAALYRKMTASKTPGHHGQASFSGALEFVIPSTGDTRTFVDDGSFGGDLAPRKILDGMSASAGDRNALINPTLAPFDNATVTSRTVRDMAKPAGLRLTLSEPVTTAQVATEVTAALGAAWDGDTAGMETVSRHFVSATGDVVSRQKFRFKLSYLPGDSRQNATTEGFSATFRYGIRTRNLNTGDDQTQVYSVTKSFPSNQIDENGTIHLWDAFDPTYTEISAELGTEVSLVLGYPGSNNSPGSFQTPGAAGSYEVIYPADGGG